jgi:hypothetical protein
VGQVERNSETTCLITRLADPGTRFSATALHEIDAPAGDLPPFGWTRLACQSLLGLEEPLQLVQAGQLHLELQCCYTLTTG